MRALVTGATGFLGTSLARHLLASGTSVRVLARSAAKAAPLVAAGAELVVGEITDDQAVRAALADVSVVYHLAGRLFIPGTPQSLYRATHVQGTRLLLDACQSRGNLVRFVHCSTTGVLGVTGAHPVGESAPYAPTNAYESTKREAELLVKQAIDQGFPAAIARPGLVYGPGDMHLLGFFRSIQRRQFRPIGRCPVWLHPIYIDDITRALLLCASLPQAVGETFHIAGREAVTIEQLATAIAGALGVPAPHGRIPLPLARAVALLGDVLPARLKPLAPLTSSRLDFLTHSRVYDVSKARRLLDFSAETDLPTGLRQSVVWYREQGLLPAPATA
jgi:nucleoside-diphosphate-sugar epimerase